MRVSSEFIERMDIRYHRGKLPCVGWVFCDWWDMRIGAGKWYIFKERLARMFKLR